MNAGLPMHYPVDDPAEWKMFGKVSLTERVRLRFRDRRFRKRAKSREGVVFERVHAATNSLGPNALVLICVARNAAKYAPSFLEHYRRLGIARFGFLDDASNDGTRDLLAQPDVDIFASNVDFRRAGGGLLWRDMLVEHYGRNRWYVSVDSDEYLVFPRYEERPLAAFIADLERHRLTRAMAVMVDIYPDRPLAEAPRDEPAAAMPTDVCPLYDASGYTAENGAYCVSVRGGPRHRMFGVNMRLNKFPVIFMDRRSQFNGGSHHGLFPIYRNFSAAHAVLLHYKFPADAVRDFQSIAAHGMHANGSSFYKAILAHKDFGEATDFRNERSTRFEGSQKLVEEGFMQDLRLA